MPLFKIYIIFRYIMKSRLSFKKLFLPVPFPGAILYHPFFLIILFLVLRFSLDAFPCWTSHINFFLFEAFFGHHQILRVDLYSSVGKSSACNVGDLGLIPGLGRSSREGKGLPAPVFWPREFHGLYTPQGLKESDMTGWLSLNLFCTRGFQFYIFV